MVATLLGVAAQAALATDSDYRIAVVDPNRVVEQSPQYEAARDALQREIEDRERDLREQQEQIAALQRQLERDGSLMSESELQRLQNDIRSRTRKVKYARDEFQDDFALRQNELRTKLSRQVQEVVVELAKEQKIDLILSDGLVYTNPRIDISDLVIERLKQEFDKSAAQRSDSATSR
ncbi:OmpH family outer membrane protein [Allochromatium palmeri]|uniref:OmpH family outer membrane protein n=1 Tax=Allochromatium palmeri TaxID=231048 RepID=A0A6N8EAS3_9GAMM|nr:OmpH family outer membrane protein [Allochromatium palmeri]MTW19969.1 OmpH family outer membrane protein [Allochromatium palmeri]